MATRTRPTRPTRPARATWQSAAVVVGCFLALLWGLELLDTAIGHRLDAYGVQPRTESGLLGVLFAPVLHFGFGHLVSNTLPVAVLGFLTLASGLARGLAATLVIWLVAGMGVWLVGSGGSVHAGASSLIFGWIVYLAVRGLLNRHWGQAGIGLLVLVAYGSALWGVLPGQLGVSWEGHLFGAIGGGLAAQVVRRPRALARPAQ